MAKLSEDGKIVTVESGDTLSEISEKYLGSGKPATYKKLAAWNDIDDPNFTIYVGQKLKLYDPGSTSSSGSSINTATIVNFGLRANSEKTLFATWKWGKVSTTASYKVLWRYNFGDGNWFTSMSTNSVDKDYEAASRISTFDIPEGATSVTCKVLPVAEESTESKSGVSKAKWTASWSTEKVYTVKTPLATPPVPTVEIDQDNLKLTATLDNLNLPDAKGIEFKVLKDDINVVKTIKATIKYPIAGGAGRASCSWTVSVGGEYKVCCRSYADSRYSDYSDYSEGKKTKPPRLQKINLIRAQSETSVYLEWDRHASAETFDIEYATEKRFFDISGNTTIVNNIETNKYEVTGLESGDEYFFRVRGVNSAGEADWSGIYSVILGSKPAAPTTWSSTTTAITGEPLKLYWVHNAEDGSKSTYVRLRLHIDENVKDTIEPTTITHLLPIDRDFDDGVIKYTAPTENDEDDPDPTGVCEIYTSIFKEGAQIRWEAQTAGVTKELGEWSTQRTIDIYAPPTLEFSITDAKGSSLESIESFPFYARGMAGPTTQTPIGYSLVITSTESYETVDNIGNVKMVKSGEAIYSKFFDITDSLLVEFTPGNIDLENNITYKATCVVSMDSGLTAESSYEFNVAWTEISYSPNVEISYDPDTYVTYLRPYCEITEYVNRMVEHNPDTNEFVVTDTAIRGNIYKERGVRGVTTTGENVFLGTTVTGIETYFCQIEKSILVDDVTLSVYRREFDGSFTELGTGLSNSANTHITDPHPALDYARYRIVAVSNSTGAVSYYDPPGYPIGEKSAIIQWDEEWSVFDTQGRDDPLDQPAWTGSLLRLPYNIDVSDSNTSDVTLVEYIGRKRPVAYYGTQLGETQDWSVTIPKDDEETLYALRRLAIWMGDVYVREPSGTGFWANVSVSFSQKHLDMTIPVSIKVTRVEGGV